MPKCRDFGGLKEGKFIGPVCVPDHVDPKKKPGFSALPTPSAWAWIVSAIRMDHVWASPNFVWSLIALAFYFAFPADLSPEGVAAQAPFSWAFFKARFPLWFAVTFGYTAFWHVTLYWLHWGTRPFLAGRSYNWDKVLHNVFWSTSGIAIWTGFENLFAFLWATGRLPYATDAESLTTPLGALKFAAAIVCIPLWRDIHFYWAHRLLHVKPIYAMVHALHHRNQDIEPFAGLSMHPIEHLYYYACILPNLIPGISPFAFIWNGMHLLLAPGASHSGYEDNFQSDQYHYAHHRWFEVNYAGTPAAILDVWFGTYMGSFADKEGDGSKAMVVHGDAKSTLRTLPSSDFIGYLLLSCGSVALWGAAATFPALRAALPLTPLHYALLAGAGPILAAVPWAFRSTGGREAFAAKNFPQFHLPLGVACCVLPVVLAAKMAF